MDSASPASGASLHLFQPLLYTKVNAAASQALFQAMLQSLLLSQVTSQTFLLLCSRPLPFNGMAFGFKNAQWQFFRSYSLNLKGFFKSTLMR